MRKWLHGIALVALVGVFGKTLMAWPHLPAQVPTHYGLSGHPDAWGGAASVWVLPVLALFTYLLLSGIGRLDLDVNLPCTIPEEKRPEIEAQSRWTLALLRAEIALFLCALQWNALAGLGSDPSLSPVLLGAGLVLLLGSALGCAGWSIATAKGWASR